MRKRWTAVFVCILMALALSACGANVAEAELSKTIDIGSTGLSISVPDSWETYSKEMDEFWVISLSHNDDAYADVSFTDYNEYEYPLKTALEDLENYYGDNIIESADKLSIDGMDAYGFMYSMVDIGEDGDEYNYYGYEYVIETPGGLLEVDIYYTQMKITSSLFKPSDDELTLLRRIAESIEKN